MTHDQRPIRRALVSVYDKSGLEALARGLTAAVFLPGLAVGPVRLERGIPAEIVPAVVE